MRVWGKERVIWLNFHALEYFMKIELKIGKGFGIAEFTGWRTFQIQVTTI